MKYWLPLLLWMWVIFSASGDRESFQRSSRIIGPLLKLVFPSMPEDQLNALVTIARKGAHLTVYAILAWLFWRAWWKPRRGDGRAWTWQQFALPVFFVALYAITDELHQHFIPNRHGSPLDVLLDTVGGAAGMLIVWKLRIWRNRRT